MSDRVGQQLGNYHLVQLLGRGGFAEVYLGEHRRLGTRAAIKVLYTKVTNAEEGEFLNEARTIAHLEHPNIVRILDFDVQDGTPFLVMGYAPHGTLRNRHPKGTRLSLTTTIGYVKQTALALQYAHDKNIIHRDIKPENILLGRYDELLLSDFGIALLAQSSRLQSTQEVVGTAYYMAPEQLQGKPRFASDQYALAVVAYEWLSGERLFHGSFIEIYSQHLSVPAPSLREKVPTIPAEINQIILTALAKDPTQRFSSVKAFATAFEQAGQMQSSFPIPTLEQKLAQQELTSESSPLVTGTDIAPLSKSFALADRATILKKPNEGALPKRGRGISRRTAIFGLVTVVLVGGGTWVILSERPVVTQAILLFKYNDYPGIVYAVAWSPDGKRIASGSSDNTVQVWNAVDGSSPYIYNGHSNAVYTVAWSRDSKGIASSSYDSTVQIWQAP